MTTQITEYSHTEAALSELTGRLGGVLWDVTKPAEMKLAKEARAELRTYRVNLEKTRVAIKAPALERTRLIDAEAKRITAALESLEDPIDAQIKAEEGRKERERLAEVERVAGIRQSIADLNMIVPGMAGKSSGEIAKRIVALQEFDVTEWAAELLGEATAAKDAAVAALGQLQAGALAAEKVAAEAEAKAVLERAELAALRAAAEERAKGEAARVAAITAAESEARAKIDAAEQASRAKIEAQEKAAREAQAESDRLASIERARLDEEKRAVARAQAELADARGMLVLFRDRHGKLPEFAPLVVWINKYLDKVNAGRPTQSA